MPTTLAHRPDLTELLDAPGPDRATLRRNLRDIRLINRALGWTAVVVREVAAVVARQGWAEFTLLDVATGSADVPLAILRWARRRNLRVIALVGDLNAAVLAVAARRVAWHGSAPWVALIRFDALQAPFADRAADVVTCSLTLHHFAPPDAVALLRELGRVARRALVVSDLERSWPAYLAARLLVVALRNRMTHHDAPVSVLRAYTADELRRLAADAGLQGARVTRHFPFRLVLVWQPEDAGPGCNRPAGSSSTHARPAQVKLVESS